MLKKTLFLFFYVLSTVVYAQDNNMKGRVFDESGIPLPGVAITVKGTARGTITDLNGNYSISVTKGQEIVFSLLGMLPQTIVYNNQSTLDITLLTDKKALEEVVVIGYQT